MSIAQESGPPKVSPIYDPKVRSIAYQVILCAVIVFLAYSAVRNAADNLARAKIASGFGFWNQTAGFDISQTLIEYTAQARHLWPRVLGRPAQHAAGRGDRHRARDDRRLPRRHRAAVEELPAVEAVLRLRRADPQRSAAAATAVLVQRRAQGAAGPARQLDIARQHLSQQPRVLRAVAGVPARHGIRRRRLHRRRHRRASATATGRARSRSAPASNRRSRWSRSA